MCPYNCKTSFNPHPSRGTGATFPPSRWRTTRRVSILTRPEGRVQRDVGTAVHDEDGFQSSPVPRDGCNVGAFSARTLSAMFQSSPVPRDGCNLTRVCYPNTPLCFNPHPSRGTGATDVSPLTIREGQVFQSSPVPRDGCNATFLASIKNTVGCFNPHPSRGTGATGALSPGGGWRRVSILTRPEGRVQLVAPAVWLPPTTVSILTRPEGRVQLSPTNPSCAPMLVSILTRPEGRVQPTPGAHPPGCSDRFQSSPVPRDGCNCRAD